MRLVHDSMIIGEKFKGVYFLTNTAVRIQGPQSYLYSVLDFG
jgi:hypothetical protein